MRQRPPCVSQDALLNSQPPADVFPSVAGVTAGRSGPWCEAQPSRVQARNDGRGALRTLPWSRVGAAIGAVLNHSRRTAVAIQLTTPMVLDLYRDAHARLRSVVSGLDSAVLNWVPGPGMNSVAGLTVHLLNSERRNFHRVLGLPWERDDTDLRTSVSDADVLVRRIDAADASLADFGLRMDSDGLVPSVDHPHHGARSPVVLLLETYGHLREHVAHLDLTRQMYQHQMTANDLRSSTPEVRSTQA